jgi:hypothetical protein
VLFVAALASGPVLWYGHASFNEMLAAALTLTLVILLLARTGSVWIVATILGTSIAKDTSLPFVVVLALGTACYASPASLPWHRRLRLPTIAAGAVLAAATVGGFNYLQFRSLLNPTGLNAVYIVPTLGIQTSFFLGIWLGPNGGVVPFWPTFAAFMLLGFGAAVAVIRDIRRGRGRALAMIPLITVTVVLGGVTLGLSKWNSPLGWIAWGPRLLLPWLPATAFLLAWSHAQQIEALVGRLMRHAIALVVPVALIVASLPQYVNLFRPGLGDSLFAPDAVCPRIAYIEKGADYYYRCTIHMMWTKHSVLLDAYDFHLGGEAFVLAAVCCAAWLWFTVNGLVTERPSTPG